MSTGGDKEEITNTKALFIPCDPNSTTSRQDRLGAAKRGCVCLFVQGSEVEMNDLMSLNKYNRDTVSFQKYLYYTELVFLSTNYNFDLIYKWRLWNLTYYDKSSCRAALAQ